MKAIFIFNLQDLKLSIKNVKLSIEMLAKTLLSVTSFNTICTRLTTLPYCFTERKDKRSNKTVSDVVTMYWDFSDGVYKDWERATLNILK